MSIGLARITFAVPNVHGKAFLDVIVFTTIAKTQTIPTTECN